MKRWKLWTAIASSVLSVGSGTTYVVWDRLAGPKVAQAAEETPAEERSPHAERPKPIPDPGGGWSPAPANFVSPAGFNDRSTVESDSGSVPGSEPSSGPSRFGAPTGVDFQSTFQVAQPNSNDGSVSRAGISDEPAGDSDPPQPPAPVPGEAPPAVPSEGPPSGEQPNGEPMPESGSQAPERPPLGGLGGQSPDKRASDPVDPETPPPNSNVPPSPLPVPNHTTIPDGIEPNERFGSPVRPSAPPYAGAGTGRPSSLPPAALPADPVPATESPVPRRTPIALPSQSASEISALVSNSPGERKLEGMQAPSLTVERSAPEEIRVGAPARFVFRVKNVGEVPAQEVIISDQVPQGTRFLSSTPEVTPASDGHLRWELGALAPGQVGTINLELLPETEGEIGSVAAVTFRAQAALRTIATRPLLKVDHSGPSQILIGEDVPVQITVSNPGSGAATGVVIEVDVPQGLSHEGGREIMSDRFDLRPNETRTLDLVLRAVEPGPVQTLVRAVGDYNLVAENRGQMEVIAPVLQVSVAGATRRFLDRPVKYQIPIQNAGTAAAREVELVARLPRGLKFVSADKKGQYDDGQHAVLWSLEELPPGERGLVELTAIPTDTGEQKLRVEARAALAMDQSYEHTTVVEDITDLVFTVTDENIPIEVGSDTTYEIRVANNGTKAARNIRLSIQTPAGLEVIDFDGPATPQQQGDRISTQPIPELGQSEEAVFRISAKGTQPGDHVLRVQLLCDEFSTPVTKEEITKVYADQ